MVKLWASLHFKAGGAQILQGSHDQPQAPTPAPETLIKQAKLRSYPSSTHGPAHVSGFFTVGLHVPGA